MKSTSIKTLLHALLIFIGLLSLNAQAGVEITYIHNDALGSPVAGTDEQGNVKWRSHYQPYGEEVLGERQLFGVRSGYTGHRDDPETGLTYMGARYYSPTIGRFMGVDPAGVNESNLHSFNRYAYANNNPYKYIDPDGGFAIIPIVIWAGGAAAFIGDVFFPGPTQLDEHGDAPLQGVSTLPGPLGAFKKTANVANKTVGRHMNPIELAKMRKTGRVQEGGGGQTRVADPSNPNTFKNAPKGDVFVEFDVPANRVLPHSKGTGRIPGPKSPDARVPGRNPADFKMPPATNIKVPGGG